jgi:hypothetical protein
MQSAFTAGELAEILEERTTLKYFSTGLKHAENIVVAPQGGFRLRDGLRLVGDLPADAARIFAFDASNGSYYDLVFANDTCRVWSATEQVASMTIDGLASHIPELTAAQRLDTMLLFHQDLQSKRIRLMPSGWVVDDVPFGALPNYDFGAVYSNGIPAEWRLEFVGLETGSTIFVLIVSGQETQSIVYDANMTVLISHIITALANLPNVNPGFFVVAPSVNKIVITFSGTGNEGDGWAVSGRVVNKSDAAVLSVRQTPGVAPGEPIVSHERGWPQCGCFYNQRLFIGGFKSLPNAWLTSKQADYFNFDERFKEANGSFLAPMDIAGGEQIEALVPSLNLLIFTTQAEYWIAERAISKTEAPNHVQASRNGIKRGVPVAENEGASLWCHANGSTIGELRYTDQEGNFVPTNISLLAPHLLQDVSDMAVRRATAAMDGNVGCVIRQDGGARLVTLLREQEVTAFARMTADGAFKAVARNGRNELSFIMDHQGSRSLERMENGLLLDEAIDYTFALPTRNVNGLSRFNGRSVWAIGDRNVFGPFEVAAGTITLPVPVSHVTVGTWRPPVVSTLPPPREVGPNTVLKRRARIHTVHISVIDTTSMAISTNGGMLREVDLHRWGVKADVPELDQGITRTIKITGLRGYSDAPFLTISQLRPGRLNVRAITVEAAL